MFHVLVTPAHSFSIRKSHSFPIANGMSFEAYGIGMGMLPHTIPMYGSSMDFYEIRIFPIGMGLVWN